MLARELATELLGYDLSTKTWSLRLVVEVDTVDSVLVRIKRQETTDTTPKTSAVELEDVLSLALDVSYIYWCTIYVDGVVYQAQVERSRVSIAVVLVESNEDLLLCVEKFVSRLTWAEYLAYQCEQYSHDNYDDSSVDNGVGIAVGVKTFLLFNLCEDARLFAYWANLRCLIAVVNIATNGTYKFLLCHIHY